MLYSLVLSLSNTLDTLFHIHINYSVLLHIILLYTVYWTSPLLLDTGSYFQGFFFFTSKNLLPRTSLNINCFTSSFLWQHGTDIIYNNVYTTGIKYMLMFYYNCFKSSTLTGTTTLLFKAVVLIYTATNNYKRPISPHLWQHVALSDFYLARFWDGKWYCIALFLFSWV